MVRPVSSPPHDPREARPPPAPPRTGRRPIRRRPRRHPAGGPDRIPPADEGVAGAVLRLRLGNRRQRPVQLRDGRRGPGPRDAGPAGQRPRRPGAVAGGRAAFPGGFAARGPAGVGQHQGRRPLLPASQGARDLRRAGRVPVRARRLPRRDRRAGPRRRPGGGPPPRALPDPAVPRPAPGWRSEGRHGDGGGDRGPGDRRGRRHAVPRHRRRGRRGDRPVRLPDRCARAGAPGDRDPAAVPLACPRAGACWRCRASWAAGSPGS